MKPGTYKLADIFGNEEKVELIEIKQEKIFDDETETFPMAIVRRADGTLDEVNPNKLRKV